MKKAEIAKEELMLAMNRSELIHDISHLSFLVKTKGFAFWKKDEIHISGRVGLESEKKEIETIVENMKGNIPVFCSLRIKSEY